MGKHIFAAVKWIKYISGIFQAEQGFSFYVCIYEIINTSISYPFFDYKIKRSNCEITTHMPKPSFNVQISDIQI